MGFLREITEEYLGALRYVKEVPRDVELPVGRDIVALVGPRRAGKTFLMLRHARACWTLGSRLSTFRLMSFR
ncbi:MAG: hypothetical protein LM573_08505 [Thermofilum sp.]|nr:hypothetical protein [Thermofilum sp.]